MKWSMLWDLSVYNTSFPFDRTCCLDKSELETCLRQETVVESYNRSCSFSFLFLQQLNSMLSTDTSPFNTSSTNSCRQHVLNLQARWVLRIHSDTWNVCFQRYPHLLRFPFDIYTRFHHWFDVITNGSYISVQSFRWTYERTALPSSLPDCSQFFAKQ